ncbi:MAG: hypothetical protein AEth_01238 [Candidatus Argoarchaeum ethanivorans]|uniref:Dockerin domain-containing protein n=1 Tax=Candidatus Argoarchaeum ethanivorans TaxID=2608793 RepID=A0A8B3S1T7_9EURY|nr:MAG: hypothetical protein AEth_01238 [Candidatus Argoarchaeum ethanivorans]
MVFVCDKNRLGFANEHIYYWQGSPSSNKWVCGGDAFFMYNYFYEDCGDVNGDDTVDINDVIFLLGYVGNPTEDLLEKGDVNCDHKINMGDMILSLNHVGDPDNYKLGCCGE